MSIFNEAYACLNSLSNLTFLFIFLLSIIKLKNEGYKSKYQLDILTSQRGSLGMAPYYIKYSSFIFPQIFHDIFVYLFSFKSGGNSHSFLNEMAAKRLRITFPTLN